MEDNEVSLAIYCRLSVEDNVLNNDSQSIINQKKMLTEYANKKGWNIFKYYIDDGYSGTNFNRPGFKEMIHDIEEGLVNTVITKDLSRLGRDYLRVGIYLEDFFPDHDVRYIALTENIDTDNQKDEFIPIRNYANEMYAKDVSKKIRFTIDAQIKAGKDTRPAIPVYGYMYQDGKRVINPETAPVVKLIYELFLQGHNYSSIANELKKREILCPLYYNYQKYGYGTKGTGECFKFDFYAWSAQTIKNILTNDCYIGTLTRGKTQSKFKSKKKTVTKEEDLHKFEDKFEAIIDKDVFDTVQAQHNIVRSQYINPVRNRYVGLAFCAVCGKPLRHKFDERKNRKDFVRLTCRSGKDICGEERGTILYEDLDKIIRKEVQTLKNTILNHKEEFIKFAKEKASNISSTDDYSLLLNQKKQIEENISKIDRYVKKAYEQRIDNILPEASYISMVNEYASDREELVNRLNSLNNKLLELEKETPNIEMDATYFIDALNKINNINCVESVNLNLLFKRIYIKTDGKRKRREKMNKEITIIYRKLDSIIKEFIDA